MSTWQAVFVFIDNIFIVTTNEATKNAWKRRIHENCRSLQATLKELHPEVVGLIDTSTNKPAQRRTSPITTQIASPELNLEDMEEDRRTKSTRMSSEIPTRRSRGLERIVR